MQIIKAARGNITGHFGDTGVPGAHVPAHLGTDIGHGNMTAADLRVVAPAAGRVVAVGREGTYGLRIVIEHDGTFSTILAHLAKALVVVGQLVDQGEEIAVMGDDGGSWPVHLHQELRKNGVPVDPELYFTTTASLTPTQIGSKLMPPHILFGDKTGQAHPYLFNPYTGKRTSLSAHQLSVYRQSATPPQERTIAQAGFDTIPKEAGSL